MTQRRLLRARCKRPRRHRAAEKGDEFAPSHVTAQAQEIEGSANIADSPGLYVQTVTLVVAAKGSALSRRRCGIRKALLILRSRDLKLIYLGRSCPQDAVHGRRNPRNFTRSIEQEIGQ